MKNIKSFEEHIGNNTIDEITDIYDNKILSKNGEIVSIVNENNQQSNYTDVETAFDIINKEIDRIYGDEVQD